MFPGWNAFSEQVGGGIDLFLLKRLAKRSETALFAVKSSLAPSLRHIAGRALSFLGKFAISLLSSFSHFLERDLMCHGMMGSP